MKRQKIMQILNFLERHTSDTKKTEFRMNLVSLNNPEILD